MRNVDFFSFKNEYQINSGNLEMQNLPWSSKVFNSIEFQIQKLLTTLMSDLYSKEIYIFKNS